MNDTRNWLLYGANGYTGQLIARTAVASGVRPVLAGRNRVDIQSLAARLGCPCRVFSLQDPTELAAGLQGISTVLHCAGPFCDTAPPMVAACLEAGVHYLDITGEYQVIEDLAQQSDRAVAAGIVSMPAVGMDVVPSDCLAAQLARAVPGANQLTLALSGTATISPGTAHTIWRNLGRGARVRREGRIVPAPVGDDLQELPLPSGSCPTMAIPWGDIASAFYTTGIPNIEVRVGLRADQARLVRRWRWMLPLAGLAPIQFLGRWWIRRRVSGPGEEELATGRTEFWGRASAGDGRFAEAVVIAPNGYRLTADAALAIVGRVQAGQVQPGFQTPASAFGGTFLEELPGVTFRWRGRPDDAPSSSESSA